MAQVVHPEDQVHFVPGMVEDTVPGRAPEQRSSALRLDTDWYASTGARARDALPLPRVGGRPAHR